MTDFLISDRRDGKTDASVRWVQSGHGRQLLVMNENEAQRIQREYALGPWQVERYGPPRRGMGAKHLAVDNLDLLLFRIFGGEVEFVTATGNLLVPGISQIKGELTHGA